jgi:hypothetical protein
MGGQGSSTHHKFMNEHVHRSTVDRPLLWRTYSILWCRSTTFPVMRSKLNVFSVAGCRHARSQTWLHLCTQLEALNAGKLQLLDGCDGFEICVQSRINVLALPIRNAMQEKDVLEHRRETSIWEQTCSSYMHQRHRLTVRGRDRCGDNRPKRAAGSTDEAWGTKVPT